MTNKRKHQLERKVRINFRNFKQISYSKDIGNDSLERITRLMLDRIQLLRYTGRLTLIEARFMSQCVRTYYYYYKNQIIKILFSLYKYFRKFS